MKGAGIRRATFIIGAVLLCLLLASSTEALRPTHHHRSCHASSFPALSKTVWDKGRWRRGDPKAATIQAARRIFNCARHPVPLRRLWEKQRSAYYRHRSAELWRVRVTPFHYAGHDWAVPYPIALCESGGDYFVGPSGAYGLIPPFPQWMLPRRQDLVAHRLYEEQGEAPWKPYEAACAYR